MMIWKRKVPTLRSCAFFSQAEHDEDEPEKKKSACNDPNNKKINIQDKESKSSHCVRSGIILAEEGRYWESLQYFDEAILCTPNEAKIYEMKAQALLELSELYPALQVAEKAVSLNTLWAEGYQTLGRCQISCGEIKQALRNFCKAVHLKPTLDEIYEEDIKWAQQLLAQQNSSLMKASCNNCCLMKADTEKEACITEESS